MKGVGAVALTELAPPSVAAPVRPARYAYADNLKVLLVTGVIVGHITAAWTGNEGWVRDEPPVRDPLLTVLMLAELVGVLFAMALFFLIAGAFTPRSVARKGLARYLADRTLRLGLPLVFYLFALAPLVEYADSGNHWDRGFPAFVAYTWRHPAPGPLWFLEVLLLFSVVYAVFRTMRPAGATAPSPVRASQLLAAGILVAVASYAVRLVVPVGEEVGQDLYLGQAPAWAAGFILGVMGAEHGWFDRISGAMSRGLFRVAWAAVAGVVVTVAVTAGVLGVDVNVFYGGGTWPSLLLAVFEGALVVAMSLWLFDVFCRRVNHQGRLMRTMGRAAFAAFVVHQVVAVGAVLATHGVGWPPEIEYVAAASLAVVGSFGIGALLVRLPGVSRIM
jgi:glucan biosynthesis protein C